MSELDEERIEYPKIVSYALDKEWNDVYIDLEDYDTNTLYRIVIDSKELLDWIGNEELSNIKESLIDEINRK